MKALFAVLFCAVANGVAGGSVSWPGGAVVNTVVHPSTKGFAYSTTQYINALPASYTYGIRPHLAYPIPQVTAFAPIPGLPAYYPVSSASYVPPNSIIYPQLSPIAPPSAPIAPIAPIAPTAPSTPSRPQQPNQPSLPSDQSNGDADTTVIESAEFVKSQQGQQEATKSDNENQPKSADNASADSASADSASANVNQDTQPKEALSPLYRNPQIAQLASFAPIPQLPLGIPQYSQFPQRNPFLQLPELPSLPQWPEFPEFPQIPQFPPSQSSPPQAPQAPSESQPQPPAQGEQSQQQPQLPQLPQFPQSQGSSSPQPPQLPSFPQLPQFLPSQGSSSSQQFPQFPSFPQLPSFPSSDNSNKGLNDEDTVAVESA